MLKKVVVLAILMAFTGGLLGLAEGGVGDGSIEYPQEGCPEWGSYEEVYPGDPGLDRMDWRCFRLCWKDCYNQCVQAKCSSIAWIPWLGKARLTACAGACGTICGRLCWF